MLINQVNGVVIFISQVMSLYPLTCKKKKSGKTTIFGFLMTSQRSWQCAQGKKGGHVGPKMKWGFLTTFDYRAPVAAFGNENEVNTCLELHKVLTVLGSFDYEPRDLRESQEELPR